MNNKNIQEMIRKAIEMEDEAKKKAFTKVIGAYMKLAYKTWNQDSVSDEVIRTNLEMLSKGQLTLTEDIDINGLINPKRSNKRGGNIPNHHHGKNGKSQKSRKKDKKGKVYKRRK